MSNLFEILKIAKYISYLIDLVLDIYNLYANLLSKLNWNGPVLRNIIDLNKFVKVNIQSAFVWILIHQVLIVQSNWRWNFSTENFMRRELLSPKRDFSTLDREQVDKECLHKATIFLIVKQRYWSWTKSFLHRL